jgi:hypothetical protein
VDVDMIMLLDIPDIGKAKTTGFQDVNMIMPQDIAAIKGAETAEYAHADTITLQSTIGKTIIYTDVDTITPQNTTETAGCSTQTRI